MCNWWPCHDGNSRCIVNYNHERRPNWRGRRVVINSNSHHAITEKPGRRVIFMRWPSIVLE